MKQSLCFAVYQNLLLLSYMAVAFLAMLPLQEGGVPVISIVYLFFVIASLLLYQEREWKMEGAVLFLISIIPIFGVSAVALADPSRRNLALLALFIVLGAANTLAHRAKPKARR